MDFDGLIIKEDGTILASGSDSVGQWSIEGKIDLNNVSDEYEYEAKFEKKYPAWTVTYVGKANNQLSKIYGKWHLGGCEPEEFCIEMQDDVDVDIEFTLEKDPPIDYDGYRLDYEKFMLFTEDTSHDDDPDWKKIKLYSQQLLQNCTLSYTILHSNTQFTKFRGSNVVVGEFNAKEVTNTEYAAAGYAQTTQNLYMVDMNNKKFANQKPAGQFAIKFLYNQGVLKVQERRDTQMLHVMDGQFLNEKQKPLWLGSALYEQCGSNDHILVFYSC